MVNKVVKKVKRGKQNRWVISLNFPLDWKLKLKFSLLPERPTPCIIKNRKWIRALRMDRKLIPIILEARGSVEKPKLVITTPNSLPRKEKEIEHFIFEFHGIKDAKDLHDFMDKDTVLRKIKEKMYGFGKAGLMSATVFEGVVKAIIQQQISLKVAESITANLVERHGGKIKFREEYAYEFPSAKVLADLSLNELRNCGLSRRKAEYVKGFSLKVADGFDPEGLRNKSPKEIVEILTAFKGIGKWTTELVMVASIGMNVIPADEPRS